MHAPSGAGLQVNTTFIPLQWVLFFCKPTIEINGHPYIVPGGVQFAPLAPGRYHVRVFVPYIFGPAYIAQTEVDIHAGHVTRMQYETGFWTMSSGTLRHLGVHPMG